MCSGWMVLLGGGGRGGWWLRGGHRLTGFQSRVGWRRGGGKSWEDLAGGGEGLGGGGERGQIGDALTSCPAVPGPCLGTGQCLSFARDP